MGAEVQFLQYFYLLLYCPKSCFPLGRSSYKVVPRFPSHFWALRQIGQIAAPSVQSTLYFKEQSFLQILQKTKTMLPMLKAFCIMNMFIAKEETGRREGGKSRSLIAVHEKYFICVLCSLAILSCCCLPPALGAAWKWALASTTKHLCGWLEGVWEEYSCWNTYHQLS